MPGLTKTPLSFFYLLMIGLILPICIAPGSALSIKITDQSMAGPQNIDVYSVVNGTHLFTGNTSSQFDADESVIIHISPDRTDYVRNPTALIDRASDYISGNLLEIVIICMVLAIFLFGWRK